MDLTEDDYDALYVVVKEQMPRITREIFPKILAQQVARGLLEITVSDTERNPAAPRLGVYRSGSRSYIIRHISTMLVAALSVTLCYFHVAIAAPDEELLGKSKGYPMGTRANWYLDDSVRVGSYTNLDKLFPNQHHVLRKAANPSLLSKVAAEPALQYRFGGRANTIDDYLAHQRVTGLLVIKDGQIL